MVFPFLIRTSVIFSGILNLKFNIPVGRDEYTTISTIVPFKVSEPCGIGLISPIRNFGRMPITTLNPMSNLSNGNPRLVEPLKEFMKNNSRDANNSFLNPNSTGYPYSKSISTPKPITSTTVKSRQAVRNLKCGSLQCQKQEVCVTWVKHSDSNSKTSKTVYECHPNDGIHYNKMNPKQFKLCDKGQTHSVMFEPQPCLREGPPCSLMWRYKCVNGTESPHNCKLRKCPSASCVEQIRCEDQPPCLIDALCLPSYLIPERRPYYRFLHSVVWPSL